jgi:hypothetical protein
MVSTLVVEVVGSIYLWVVSESNQARIAEGSLLGLFAVAGALGGSLRSLAYLLGFVNFSARERRQWRIEAIISPVLGATAGLGAYLLVRASLVQGTAGVNRAGQYILSVVVGSIALNQLGRVIERGLVRGTLNRSGILGGEVSSTVPLLERIERTIEQRATEYSLYNYDGWAIVSIERQTAMRWILNIHFDSNDPSESTSESEILFFGRIQVLGGNDRDIVPFSLSVVSDLLQSIPLSLSVNVQHEGRSEPSRIIIQAPDDITRAPQEAVSQKLDSIESHIAVEVGQGSQVLQVIPIDLSHSPN